MDADAVLLLYGALFAGVLLLVDGTYHLLRDLHNPRAAVNRRLRMLASGRDPEEVLRLLRRQDPRDHGWAGRLPLYQRLDTLVTQSGARTTPLRVLLIMAGVAVVIVLVLRQMAALAWLPATAFAVTLAVAGPLLCLAAVRRRRLTRFGQQLPDALDLIVRSLRAGHPLGAALDVAAQELPDPIGSELGTVIDETTYGLSLQDAVNNMGTRVGHPDLHYFVIAIRIQYGTGGNLAEILAGLAKIIRARLNMDRKISAVSAEGRLSAIVLSAMPLVTAGLVTLIDPDYYGAVANDPIFPGFVYVTLVLIVVNLVVMHKLTRFHY